ncbi:type II secretion system F family protein [Testudinibacter sp. P27/CKL/0425]
MAEFRWRGINALQCEQQGSLLADNAEQAQAILLGRGLQQLKIQRNWRLPSKVSHAEICELMQQMALLLQAALPLKNVLLILQQHTQQEKLLRWLQQLIQGLESGYSFSQTLQQNPQFLTERDRQLIRIGELSGRLPQICRQIADDKNEQLALQRKLQKILLYPLLVLGVSLLLTVLLLLFIVPQFAEMYQQNQQQLPHFTRFLLQLSDILHTYGGRLLILLSIFSFGARYFYQHNRSFRAGLQHIARCLPLFGGLNQLRNVVDSSRNLGLMLNAGVPLNQALQSFLNSSDAPKTALQQEITHSLQLLQQGYAFSQSVSSRWMPQQAQQMLVVGEKSGALGPMLQHIAENYQRQLNHRIDLLSQLLEPLLMLVIGGLIGAVMLGMYLPIFDMGAMLG